MAGERRVHRTVHYHHTDGRIRTAVITALGSGNLVDLRVGHHGETYSGVDLKTGYTQVTRWYWGSRRKYA